MRIGVDTNVIVSFLIDRSPAQQARAAELFAAAAAGDLLSLPGVLTIDELDWSAVLSLWPRRIADFGDACLAAVAKSGAFDSLATFDARFRRRLRRQGLATHW